MNSLGFSNFRELMDQWDKASMLFQENDLCLFFKKDGVIYGATEPNRITYARMKNPESKDDLNWSKEATFSAYDLEKSSEGKNSMVVFGASDTKKIKAITQEEAEKELKKKGKKMPSITDDDQEKTFGEE